MLITEAHFDPKETQEWFILWLRSQGHKPGDNVPGHAYQLWNSDQWAAFKVQNGYPKDCFLHTIENWQERFTQFLQSQLEAQPCM